MADPELVQMVAARWGFASVHAVQRITGGEWNDVWRLTADRGDYVLRLNNSRISVESVRWEHKLLLKIAPSASLVVAPIHDRFGDTMTTWGGRAVTLFPLANGRAPRRGEVSSAVAGRTLAQLHRVLLAAGPMPQRPEQPALAEMDWDTNHMWDWRQVEAHLASLASRESESPDAAEPVSTIAGHTGFIAAERERMAAWVRDTAKHDPLTGVIHGDFFRGNLLVRDAGVVAVVDWDEAHPDWLAYELGWTAWEFCHHGPTLDLAAFDAFVAAYREHGGPVPASEQDLLLPAIRCRHIVEVLWALGRGVFDAGYCLQGIEALKRLPMAL